MPTLEIKSIRNRSKRTRSRLHLSSTPVSPIDTPSESPSAANTLHPINTTTITATTTGPSSSSSDERPHHSKSPASSISSSSFFDDEQWKRVAKLRERDGLRDTVFWGYCLLVTTWALFVLGIGGVCGVWEWSLRPIRTDRSGVVDSLLWGRLMVGVEGG